MEEYSREEFWSLLVETVHDLVMYPRHKAYTRETILQENPDINPEELSATLNITLGESLVILHELGDQDE